MNQIVALGSSMAMMPNPTLVEGGWETFASDLTRDEKVTFHRYKEDESRLFSSEGDQLALITVPRNESERYRLPQQSVADGFKHLWWFRQQYYRV
jgi:hypothetical protein